MTPEEIADKLWQKYAADLPAEKRAHAAITIAEVVCDLDTWPELWVSIIRSAIHALRAWRDTKDTVYFEWTCERCGARNSSDNMRCPCEFEEVQG